MRDLLNEPIWKESDLGLAIPDNKHAVSVALPTWNDVIDYEEKLPKCMNSLRSIYPRFGLNPLLRKLAQEILSDLNLENHNAWPYGNINSALKAKNYCDFHAGQECSFIEQKRKIRFLITTGKASEYARSFWQHSGLGASSREAAIDLFLEKAPARNLVKECNLKIINRIAKNSKTNPELIYLTSSGMSALHTALEIIYKVFPKKPTLQIGFPYVDVLKLPQKIFYGAKLITEEDCQDLEFEIKKIDPAALIIELPSNPMLRCVNIKRISIIAKKLNIPIITDDTVGSNININSLGNSDIVFTSLTKIFAGTGDILAGSFILNPRSKWIKEFKEALSEIEIPDLSDSDIVSLEKASRDIVYRVKKQNKSCLELKKRLEDHKSIKRIFHPEKCKNYISILKDSGGYGCLFSFELKGGFEKTKQFYDSLQLTKGPSLGTKFTLVSPYVQLAHYKELSWAESFGIPSHLIRVSVGLEDIEVLLGKFSKALDFKTL